MMWEHALCDFGSSKALLNDDIPAYIIGSMQSIRHFFWLKCGPLGPRVTLTAFASTSTPVKIEPAHDPDSYQGFSIDRMIAWYLFEPKCRSVVWAAKANHCPGCQFQIGFKVGRYVTSGAQVVNFFCNVPGNPPQSKLLVWRYPPQSTWFAYRLG